MKFFLTFFFAIALSSCKAQDADTSTTIDAQDPIAVKIGERTTFETQNIRFDSVVDDSRCPEGTQCIWAGEAKVTIAILENEEERAQELVFGADGINETNPQLLYTIGTTEIQAIGLEPYPKEGATIQSSDYQIILKKVNK